MPDTNYIATSTELTATADAIRSKTGGSAAIEWEENKGFEDAIDAIQTALPTQTKSATPTESAQTITPDSGYVLDEVDVGAIASDYVGSGITRRSSTDLQASGATVTAPAGYYSAAASKTVASGSATAPASISGTSATVSTGTNTLTLSKTISVTPTVTAGYVSAGTAGNVSVSLTGSVTTKAAATITPGTSNQTIAAGTYLTGAQTIAGDADLVAGNIKKDVNLFNVIGTYEGEGQMVIGSYTGSGGSAGSSNPTTITTSIAPKLLLLHKEDMGSATGSAGTFILIDYAYLTTSYKTYYYGSSTSNSLSVKKSSDGKTLYLYHATSTAEQYNTSGKTYRYIAFA